MVYGARPIPDASHPGEESCSQYTSTMGIGIPSGYSWVKVWLFKATLEPRQYLYSRQVNTFAQTVLCDGRASGTSTNDYASTHVCYRGAAKPYTDYDPGTTTSSSALAKRMNLTPQTFLGQEDFSAVDPDGAGVLQIGFNMTRYACFLPSRDPAVALGDLLAGQAATSTTFAGGLANQVHPNTDAWTLYQWSDPSKRINTLGLNTDENYGIAVASDPEAVTIDTNNNYDFLFVVTPDTVHSKEFDMDGGTLGSTTAQQYTPFRFKSNSVCNPYVLGCENSVLDKVIHYRVTRFDVSEIVDPSSGRGPVFPICALQKN
jgi:hypothetical protein